MAKKLYGNVRKKVIPFDQNAEFFHRKARKFIENNNYINALTYYRKAVEKEPDNIDYLLDLSEVFAEMGYYNESNKILYYIISKDPSAVDCYFGIGCNFLGLHDFDKAQECFEIYVDISNNGVYIDEALDIIEILKNQEYYSEKYSSLDPIEERMFNDAVKGKDLLDKGDYKKAVKVLEKIASKEPVLTFVRNNLAIAYYCTNNIDKAIDQCNRVLKNNPNNIHANCNIALFLHEKGEIDESKQYVQKILKLKSDDPEELQKIAVTLCELKYHSEANKMLKILLRYKPYDLKVLHYMGVSCFNLNRFKAALSYWNKINKIEPNNHLSAFYKRHVKSVMNGEKKFKELLYNFQVPYDEVLRRIREIEETLKLPKSTLKDKWEREDTLLHLFNWSLELNDDQIKNTIINVVASFGDKKAEKFLRDFIFRKDENKELITEALVLLKNMNAPEPYIAYVGDNLVEVLVSVSNSKNDAMEKMLKNVPQYTIDNMHIRYGTGFEGEIKKLWETIAERISVDTIIRRKLEGWAAALELYYCITKGWKINKSVVADVYSISYTTLMNNYKTIIKAMDEGI